jgi:hypothetical protein
MGRDIAPRNVEMSDPSTRTIASAEAAPLHAETDPLTHDSILAVFSARGLGGRWEAPDQLVATSIFGDIKLDFTRASLPPSGIVEIQAQAIFGALEILVPDGSELEIEGSPIFGSIDHKIRGKGAGERLRELVTNEDSNLKRGEGEEPPFFRVTGMAIFGSITVKSR